jgi:multidrug efflux pump subunit AcrB
VELGAQNDDTYSRLNGRPAVTIGIFLSPGANAIRTAAAVKATLDKVRTRFPDGLQAQVIYDSTVFVNDTVREVLKTLFEAFVLVAIVVFLFLGDLRATIVPVIAVPVSLIGAFIVLVALGYSANTISLLALVLAIGIVVDDAIVVVENVERVMEEEPNLSPTAAAKKAMTQVTAADHCHHARAAIGLRPGRVHRQDFGCAVPAVCGHDHRRDAHLGIQCAHAVACLVCGVLATLRPPTRSHGVRESGH